jgi:signal transduction histidine kinase
MDDPLIARDARELLEIDSLFDLLDKSHDGFALLDAEGNYLHINSAGTVILRVSDSELMGTRSPWVRSGEPDKHRTLILDSIELEYEVSAITARDSEIFAVQFRDVSVARLRERQLAAFAAASANIALATDLSVALNGLAEEVWRTAAMYSCTFLLYGEDGTLQQAGTAGEFPRFAGYQEGLARSQELGAPLISDEVLREGKLHIVRGWRKRVLRDTRFLPLHDFIREAEWDTIVVVPLIVGDTVLGVFNGFYLDGLEPDEVDLPFLQGIADHAAIAVDWFRMRSRVEAQAASEERGRLARDLHDSVNQILFSISLQSRALEADSKRGISKDDLEDGLRELRESSELAFGAMRGLLAGMRGTTEADGPEALSGEIRRYLAALVVRTGMSIHFSAQPFIPELVPKAHDQLLGVVREALNNVGRHAPNASVEVRLRLEGDEEAELVLEIADNGPGFDATVEHPGHLGLVSMRERMATVGGSFSIASDAEGTRLSAVVPRSSFISGRVTP